MFFKDSNLKYKYINQRCAEIFNCEKDEMINKDDSELLKENKIDTSKTYVDNYQEADALLYEVKRKGKNSILIQ